jgi:hypothetical protein
MAVSTDEAKGLEMAHFRPRVCQLATHVITQPCDVE